MITDIAGILRMRSWNWYYVMYFFGDFLTRELNESKLNVHTILLSLLFAFTYIDAYKTMDIRGCC